MKALTIKQPYATMIMTGQKRFEIRKWMPSAGTFVVHAGKSFVKTVGYTKKDMVLGAGLGIAKVIGIWDLQVLQNVLKRSENEQYGYWIYDGNEAYAWELKVLEIWNEPIFARGQLGLWNWR